MLRAHGMLMITKLDESGDMDDTRVQATVYAACVEEVQATHLLDYTIAYGMMDALAKAFQPQGMKR